MKTTNNRYCHYCGLEFEPRTANQIYCNSKCYQLAVHPTKPTPQPRACAWCHAMYTPNKFYSEKMATYQKFCCCICRDAFHSMRQHVFNQYFFENAKMHEEIGKLEKEGRDYVMPSKT